MPFSKLGLTPSLCTPLARMGYRRVFSMEGGWRRWCELGYPVATD